MFSSSSLSRLTGIPVLVQFTLYVHVCSSVGSIGFITSQNSFLNASVATRPIFINHSLRRERVLGRIVSDASDYFNISSQVNGLRSSARSGDRSSSELLRQIQAPLTPTSESEEYYYYDYDDGVQHFQNRQADDGHNFEDDPSDEGPDSTTVASTTTAASDTKSPLNFLQLLGTDFQPGRLVNIFFGLIVLLFMMIAQGYAMWVFGIAFLPGTRSFGGAVDWNLDTNRRDEIFDEVLSALEATGVEMLKEFEVRAEE